MTCWTAQLLAPDGCSAAILMMELGTAVGRVASVVCI